jgi:hypothetical protein
MAVHATSLTLAGRGGYNAPLTNAGRGGYNGPSEDDEDDRSMAPRNFGRGGYNAPLKYGSDDDDEHEDGRGGYN